MVQKPANRNYPPPVYIPRNNGAYQPDEHEGDFKRLVDERWRQMFPQGLNGNRLSGRLPREGEESEDEEDIFW